MKLKRKVERRMVSLSFEVLQIICLFSREDRCSRLGAVTMAALILYLQGVLVDNICKCVLPNLR